MGMVKMTIIDNVTVGISEGMNTVRKCLSYPSEYWVKGQYSGHLDLGRKSVLLGPKGGRYFYAGLLPRVLGFLKGGGYPYRLEGEFEPYRSCRKPTVPGITFRPDQVGLMSCVLVNQRGVLLSPMGSGKTVLAMGLVSAYPSGTGVLYLCPNNTLVAQTAAEFRDHGFKGVAEAGDGRRDYAAGVIMISTVQTAARNLGEVVDREFDVVIVDEIHKMSGMSGQLEKVLAHVASPVRVGFTATEPEDPAKRFTVEGLIGPVLGELTRKEAVDLEIMAEPRVKLVPVPTLRDVASAKTYRDQYRYGIVENDARNRLAAHWARWIIEKAGSVVVSAFELDHLSRLSDALTDIGIGKDVPGGHVVIHGETSKGDRETIRKSVEAGDIPCVVSSLVWREGVNIRSLGGIVLATGWKDRNSLLQWAGRALRRTDSKEVGWIVDFLDPYSHLAEHTVQRIGTYVREGWL